MAAAPAGNGGTGASISVTPAGQAPTVGNPPSPITFTATATLTAGGTADGTVPPVELVPANRVVKSLVTAGQHENNMPTWAPPGDLHWVAFNSVRAGARTRCGTRKVK